MEGHLEARRRFLRGLVEEIERNRSVDGVLLCGSLGRGEGDVWSDIDLVVFIDDSAIEATVAERHRWPLRFGDVLYGLDSFGTHLSVERK